MTAVRIEISRWTCGGCGTGSVLGLKRERMVGLRVAVFFVIVISPPPVAPLTRHRSPVPARQAPGLPGYVGRLALAASAVGMEYVIVN